MGASVTGAAGRRAQGASYEGPTVDFLELADALKKADQLGAGHLLSLARRGAGRVAGAPSASP
jgi:hypothetical protein